MSLNENERFGSNAQTDIALECRNKGALKIYIGIDILRIALIHHVVSHLINVSMYCYTPKSKPYSVLYSNSLYLLLQ